MVDHHGSGVFSTLLIKRKTEVPWCCELARGVHVMSEKDGTAGRRGGGGRGRGRYQPNLSPYNKTPRAYISPVVRIENDTFNTGHSKFASQFKTSRWNVANFVQRSLRNEGYLVVKTIKTGE